jgi:hypothetical protein
MLYPMSSYAGIIRKVHISCKRSFDRTNTTLEFMAAGWSEDEDRHATLLALLSCLYVQIRINRGCLATELLVSLSKAWRVL